MARHRLSLQETVAGGAIPDPFPPDLRWPFGCLSSLSRDEVRCSAYEIFFAACRSTSAGGRHAVAGENHEGGQGTKTLAGGKNMVVTSHLKRSLGLRARKTRSMVGARPMTSAEIMRRQMGVSEETDGRVRKTLARCLVGPQLPKKVESLVLPMELLRRLKASEFADADEYHLWQFRQLKLLEAGLVSHPFVPLDRSAAASSLSEMIRSTELQINVRALSTTVMALAWRSVDVCHWADGYPLNVHLYLSLLCAVFDLRDQMVVLDEVDELLELIKKTWNVLGLNRMVHNVCFTWVLFERYVTTGQIEPDLLSATLVMLHHVSEDAMKAEREPGYSRVLSATLASMYSWAENKLIDYHEAFDNSAMKNIVTLSVSAAEMLSQHVPAAAAAAAEGSSFGTAADLIEHYIKSSVRRSFAKLEETGEAGGNSMMVEVEDDPSETGLMYVAAQTKEMARLEKDLYAPILKRWHPCPAAIAAITLHTCFGAYFKRYVSKMGGCLSSESMRALQMVTELDKYLIQTAHDDGDGHGRVNSKQMIPYDVDSIVVGLVTEWMDDRLRIGTECVRRARDSETWNPGSKAEPYAQSAVDLMKLAKATVDELMDIHQQWPMLEPIQHLVDGFDRLVHQYSSFLSSSCGAGTKESYIPQLPPLTRCGQDKGLLHHLMLNLHCSVGGGSEAAVTMAKDTRVPRPSTSCVTQRLYVRLNTLHYMLGVLHSIDRSLAPRGQQRHINGHRRARSSSFDRAYPAAEAAVVHVTELSAYRLVFLDSAHCFHRALYQWGVAGARIRPALRIMKQNLAFMCSVLGDRAQPLAVREVMKASVEAFLMVLLAGGSGRAFSREDYSAVAEDFASLKRLFCSCGEGLVKEEVVETEFATAEGVVDLMALPTEKLIDEFRRSSTSCTAPPPATRRWSRSDANTLLRVLCHRDDEAANRFLKKSFDLPKRR
ncbi:unnamed protein product [Alopecurus aequalis]